MGPLAVAAVSNVGHLPGLNFPQPSPAASSSRSSSSQRVAACVPLSCYHTLLSNFSSKLYAPERRLSGYRSPWGVRAAQRIAEGAEQAAAMGIGLELNLFSESETVVHHLYSSPFLKKDATEALLKEVQERISSDVISIETEQCYNIELRAPLAGGKYEVLKWLLREIYEPQLLQSSSFLEARNTIEGNASSIVVEVGPQLNFTTAWSANAISICGACALAEVSRIERSRRYLLRFKPGSTHLDANLVEKFSSMVHDRMTECVYPSKLKTFATNVLPEPVIERPVLEDRYAERDIAGSLEESATEEAQHSISQGGEPAASSQTVDGDADISGEREEKEVDSQEEKEVQLSLERDDKSGETSKDLLLEFLKKRSDNIRPFVGETSVLLKTQIPDQRNDPLHSEELFGETVLYTSTKVRTTQEQVSESPNSLMDDGENVVPKGLIQEILSISQSLPPNASLETFLTPFCGQMSTNDGNLVLKSLGENHLTWPMLSFFQWMRVHVPCLLDSRSFCTLFTYLGKLRVVDQALLQYENMPEDGSFHCVQVYNALLGALSRSGRPENIPIILQEMEKRNIERDTVTYSILITATKGVKERYEKVWRIFDDFLQEGVKPSVTVYGSLIKAFCDEGQLKQALLVSLSMEKMGVSPNVLIYNTLIDAHARASQFEEAEGLLLEMKQRGFRPIESTYNALINGYGRNGQLDVAEELLLEMQEKEGLKPNVVTYTSLISAYGKHFSSEKAMNVFLRMRKNGLIPNAQTYTVLINAYAEGGWHEKAQWTFDSMLREGLKPTIETHTALLDGYRRAGDLDMVRHVWNTIKTDGCELTKITYRTIVDAFAKHGLYVEARDVMDEFRKRGLQPDTMIFNMLLNAYARGGLSTKLRKVYLEMQTAGCEPDSFTYCTLIYSFIRLRDFTSAFKYDEEMLEKGVMPNPIIYRKLRSILDAKYAEKRENDKKANSGQDPESLQQPKKKNPQRAKRNFKRYQKQGPARGSERAKALWKTKEEQGLPRR